MENWGFDELIEAVEEGFDSIKNYNETRCKAGDPNYTEIDYVFTAAAATANDFTGPWLDRESGTNDSKVNFIYMCRKIWKNI